MGQLPPPYKQILERELSERQATNPRYSMRAYAQSLGVDVSTVSKVLAGKRGLTIRTARKIVAALRLSDDEGQLFVQSVIDDQLDAHAARDGASRSELDLDTFKVIADLYHYAILELTQVEGFRGDVRWIARQLGITVIEAEHAVARLIRLGLLERDGDRLVKTAATITTGDRNMTSEAHRAHQRQVLKLALSALDVVDLSERSMMSTTMAIDPRRLTVAKVRMQEFLEEICQYLEGGERTAVYQLGLSLFPLKPLEGRKHH